MRKDWTDAKFEVVKGSPEPRDLPRWFKTLVFALATLFLLALPIWKFNEAHRPPPEVGATAGPPSPPVR